MILIGLSGKARVGKDTAAIHLLDYWGLEPMSFAAPIKIAVQQIHVG